MHMLLFFAIYIYALAHGVNMQMGLTWIMVIYAIFSDLLLYSLASQWVKKPNSYPNVRGPFIRKVQD